MNDDLSCRTVSAGLSSWGPCAKRRWGASVLSHSVVPIPAVYP